MVPPEMTRSNSMAPLVGGSMNLRDAGSEDERARAVHARERPRGAAWLAVGAVIGHVARAEGAVRLGDRLHDGARALHVDGLGAAASAFGAGVGGRAVGVGGAGEVCRERRVHVVCGGL